MTTPHIRYHYMDQIRAHMMLLGILFHAIVPYLKLDPKQPWAFNDPVSHPLLFGLLVGIHLFRMPVFFIVAGFFCALVIQRWGVRHLLKDRIQRIALPLLVLAIPMHLLGRAITDHAAAMLNVPDGTPRIFDTFTVGYLWFLYFLMIYYLGVALWMWIVPARWRQALGDFLRARSLVQLALLFGGVIALAIHQLNAIFIPAPLQWNPSPGVLLYYAAFFGLGMALHGHPCLHENRRGRLPVLWLCLLVSVVFCCVSLPMRDAYEGSLDGWLETGWGLVFAVAAVSASLLVIFFYQRYFSRESAVGRYAADSAYWMYLAHFPLTLILPVWLYPLPVAPTLKFLLVVVLVTLICLVTYQAGVRHTRLGLWLNGKKYASHSWRKASMGLRLAALRAGK